MSTDLIKALFKGVVTVVFEKIDTKEIRTMPCTLNQELHKQHIDIKNINVWDMSTKKQSIGITAKNRMNYLLMN